MLLCRIRTLCSQVGLYLPILYVIFNATVYSSCSRKVHLCLLCCVIHISQTLYILLATGTL